MASLADTTSAAQAFERVRVMWLRNDPNERSALRRELDAFVRAFSSDGLATLARLYAALSYMDAPALWPEAEQRLALEAPPPPGAAHDVFLVADAKRLRYHHQPDAAFELLRPIVGKVVDARVRAILQEELTFDALEAREPYEAIAYMDAWLRSTLEEDRDAAQAKVAVALGAVPEAALRGSLQAMRASAKGGESHGYGVAIERLVAERLGQIAVERGDAALARWLLDPAAGEPLGEDVSATLGRLATSRRGIANVVGRTVGLVLPTSSAELRDEAADVLRGVLWALDVVQQSAEQSGPRADPHDAPTAGALGDPLARDGAVRLVTRDDGGDAARLQSSLEEVAGEGASVVITALEGTAAEEALRWGKTASVDVIVLASAASAGSRGPGAGTPSSGFDVGEDWTAELAILARSLGARNGPSTREGPRVATLVDSEAAEAVTAFAGREPSWGAPVSCDVAPTVAGESRFPVTQWDKEGVHRWLVAGSLACAEDLFRGLRAGGRARSGVVALSLESSETRERPPAGVLLLRVAAGMIPALPDRSNLAGRAAGPLTAAPSANEPLPADGRAADIRSMVARTGTLPGWWAALGHDAAVLAQKALAKLPADTTFEAGEIARRRAAIHRALLEARAPLWTSEQDGFDKDGTLQRALRVLE